MYSKKWVSVFFSFSFFMLTSIYIINYTIDSYSIFKKDFSSLYREPNQNYIKMKFLLNHKHDFDSFIFGSSRVGKINPQNLPDGKYYNMTYSEGLPLEHLENIKLLINNGINIKHLLIGLDDFSYQIDPMKHLNEPMRLPHYNTDINAMSVFEFFNFYLLRKPSSRDISKNISSTPSKTLEYDIYQTGLPLVPEHIDSTIENNISKHIQNPKFLKPSRHSGNRVTQTLLEIKKIIALSKKYNIHCTFFINPIHKTTYLATNLENFQLFKDGLAKLTDFYDFSGLNSITTNNYYYYEASHYRIKTGDIILDRLFKRSLKVPNDFGILVTKDTIDEHLKNLNQQIKKYHLQNKMNDNNTPITKTAVPIF